MMATAVKQRAATARRTQHRGSCAARRCNRVSTSHRARAAKAVAQRHTATRGRRSSNKSMAGTAPRRHKPSANMPSTRRAPATPPVLSAPPSLPPLPCNRRSNNKHRSSKHVNDTSGSNSSGDACGVTTATAGTATTAATAAALAGEALTPCVLSIMLTWAQNDALHDGGAVPYLLSNGSYGVYFAHDGSCLQLMHVPSASAAASASTRRDSDTDKSMLQFVLYVDGTGCGFAFLLHTPDPRDTCRYEDEEDDNKDVDKEAAVAAAMTCTTSARHAATRAHVAALLQQQQQQEVSSSRLPGTSCVVVPSALHSKFALLMWMRRWRRSLHRPDGPTRPAALVHVTHDATRWLTATQRVAEDNDNGNGDSSSHRRSTDAVDVANVGFGVRVLSPCALHNSDDDDVAAAQWRVPYVCRIRTDAASMPDSSLRCVVTLANVLRPYRDHVYVPASSS